MVVKKVSKSKNNIKTKVKTKTKISSKKNKDVVLKDENISQDETQLIEKTFDLVKKLNSDVKKVSLVKKKLEAEVKNLNHKIDLKDENEKSKTSNILTILKEELIKEFTPLLKKFDLKAVKIDMFKEISNILELEIAKVKSGINSKNNKLKNDFKKEYSLIETRIIDALKSNENLSKKINKFEKVKIKSMFLEIEEKLNITFNNKQKEVLSLFNSNINKIEELKENIDEQKNQYSKLNQNLSKFKTDIKKLVSQDNIDLVSLNSKIDKLDKEHHSINSLISSYEDKLYSLKGEISKEVNLSFQKDISKLNNLLKDLEIKQKGIEEIVFDEARKIVKEEAMKIIKGNFEKYSTKFEIKFDNLKKTIDNSNISFKDSLKQINIEKESQQDLLINKYNEIVTKIENFEKELNKKNNSEIKNLKDKFSNELKNILNKEIDRNNKNSNENILNIENKLSSMGIELSLSIKENLSKFEIEKKSIEKKFEDTKNELLVLVKNYINEVDKEIKNIKSVNEKILLDKENLENTVNKKTLEISSKLNNALQKIEDEKQTEREVVTSKINDIIDKFETLSIDNKVSISQSEKRINTNISKDIENQFNIIKEEVARFKLKNQEFFKKLSDDNKENKFKNSQIIENKISTFVASFEEEVKTNINLFSNQIKNIEEKFSNDLEKQVKEKDIVITDLNKFKIEITEHTKKFTKDVEIEIKNIRIEENVFNEKTQEIDSKLNAALEKIEDEKQIEREVITSKINEIIDKFETLSIDNKVSISQSEKKINTNISKDIENQFNIIKEEVARFKLKNQEFLKKLSDDNKEDKFKNSQIIENKISTSVSSFEEEIKKNINLFSNQIKNIEEKFSNDLEKQIKEKDIVISDLSKFRDEITEHTKKFTKDVEIEIKNIKIEESVFNEKKELAIGEFNEFILAKKDEINDLEKQIELQISTIIEEEKEKQQKNDNNFKNLFNEKISNLIEVTNNKLNKFEKKFVEKNLAQVEIKVNQEKEKLNLINTDLISKSETISKQLEEIDNKQRTIYEDLKSEEIKINQRAEDKLKEIEIELNKKFLGIDSKFSEFKGVVIDEVEDLIKEVQTIVGEKVSVFDKSIAKITFLNNETTNNINEFNRIAKGFENEMINLRNEVSDIRVKAEIMTPEIHSLNDHIHYMKTYEEQLIGVIRSLKHRGLTDDSIQTALSTKGHPRFYVAMILREFEELYN